MYNHRDGERHEAHHAQPPVIEYSDLWGVAIERATCICGAQIHRPSSSPTTPVEARHPFTLVDEPLEYRPPVDGDGHALVKVARVRRSGTEDGLLQGTCQCGPTWPWTLLARDRDGLDARHAAHVEQCTHPYQVNEAVFVDAFGRLRPGVVTNVHRTRIEVDFVRNGRGDRATRRFPRSDVFTELAYERRQRGLG